MFKIFARYWLFLYICIKQLTKRKRSFKIAKHTVGW